MQAYLTFSNAAVCLSAVFSLFLATLIIETIAFLTTLLVAVIYILCLQCLEYL